MKRLYYLAPSLNSVDKISADLHEQGISDWRFHIISKDESGLHRHHLHSATTLQRTDLVRYVERGIIVGVLLGLCFIVPLAYLEEFTLNAWLAISVFCMIFGAWTGGVGGITQENYKIRRFHDEIEKGFYLIMVDTKKQDEERVQRIMAVWHPEASLQGHSSTHINPFVSSDSPKVIAH